MQKSGIASMDQAAGISIWKERLERKQTHTNSDRIGEISEFAKREFSPLDLLSFGEKIDRDRCCVGSVES